MSEIIMRTADAQVQVVSMAGRPPAKQAFIDGLLRGWSFLRKLLVSRTVAKKSLRICETAPLGDKRFVAVIQVDNERFLVGGAPNSVALLSKLADVVPFPSPEQNYEGEGSPDLE
jgi:flagellar biogenesis protein FliO